MKIDIQNSSVRNAQFGDGNMMVSSSGRTIQDDDWEELQEILEERKRNFSVGDKEYIVAQKAIGYADKKDVTGLRTFIRENKGVFFTNLLSNLASTGVMQILTRLGV